MNHKKVKEDLEHKDKIDLDKITQSDKYKEQSENRKHRFKDWDSKNKDGSFRIRNA